MRVGFAWRLSLAVWFRRRARFERLQEIEETGGHRLFQDIIVDIAQMLPNLIDDFGLCAGLTAARRSKSHDRCLRTLARCRGRLFSTFGRFRFFNFRLH